MIEIREGQIYYDKFLDRYIEIKNIEKNLNCIIKYDIPIDKQGLSRISDYFGMGEAKSLIRDKEWVRNLKTRLMEKC